MLAALGLWIVGVFLMRKPGGDEPGPVAAKVVYAWSMLCLLAAAATFAEVWLPVWPPGFALRKEGDRTQVIDGGGALVARGGKGFSGSWLAALLGAQVLLLPRGLRVRLGKQTRHRCDQHRQGYRQKEDSH